MPCLYLCINFSAMDVVRNVTVVETADDMYSISWDAPSNVMRGITNYIIKVDAEGDRQLITRDNTTRVTVNASQLGLLGCRGYDITVTPRIAVDPFEVTTSTSDPATLVVGQLGKSHQRLWS